MRKTMTAKELIEKIISGDDAGSVYFKKGDYRWSCNLVVIAGEDSPLYLYLNNSFNRVF